jgi:uncharacterized membrane protein
MNPLRSVVSSLRASLWFVPTLVVTLSIIVAVTLVETDALVGLKLAKQWPRLFGASAAGSRAMLSAVATSMMTVAGVVFSITIVALSLTSTQYSPRVLRNFMRDRPTQVVLGVFVGIFAYCMVVLRTIRGSDYGDFIPSLAVLGGLAYAFFGIAMLIFFIHHVAQSIQASSILARIAKDTQAAIEKLFPEQIGQPPDDADADADTGQIPHSWTRIEAARGGYITAVDSDKVLKYAIEHDRVLRLSVATGDFVVEGACLLEISGAGAVTDDEARRMRGWLQTGRQRTVEQDAAFGLQQLVDVALKALSPGINDPTTACMCIDQLSALLTRLASRHMPGSHRMTDNRLRVIAPSSDFAAMLAITIDPIVQHSRSDVQVLARLLDALAIIAGATRNTERRHQIARAGRVIYRELQRVEPPLRSVLLRRRARTFDRSLRQGAAGGA